jgi:hypothetical protein
VIGPNSCDRSKTKKPPGGGWYPLHPLELNDPHPWVGVPAAGASTGARRRGATPSRAPQPAFALVPGANLGTAINPLVEGQGGDDPAAKRLPFGNLIGRILGVAVTINFLGPIAHFMTSIEPTSARAVADFSYVFNLVVAAVSLPLLGPYASLLRRPPRWRRSRTYRGRGCGPVPALKATTRGTRPHHSADKCSAKASVSRAKAMREARSIIRVGAV